MPLELEHILGRWPGGLPSSWLCQGRAGSGRAPRRNCPPPGAPALWENPVDVSLTPFHVYPCSPPLRAHQVLLYLDIVWMCVFMVEAALKIVAYGFAFNGSKSYLRDGWWVMRPLSGWTAPGGMCAVSLTVRGLRGGQGTGGEGECLYTSTTKQL